MDELEISTALLRQGLKTKLKWSSRAHGQGVGRTPGEAG